MVYPPGMSLLLDSWAHGRPTLRVPLPDAPALVESAR